MPGKDHNRTFPISKGFLMRFKHFGGVLALAVLAVALATLVLAQGQKMSIQVKNGQLRATPSFLGSVVAGLAYGDQVTVVKSQGPWFQVKDARSRSGWIHQSALTEKRIVMTAGTVNAQTTASGEELALAGKGFNSDVEAEFKAQNQDIDFTWVDKMEQIKVSPEESVQFLAQGLVAPSEGGAP
jgi:SH3-like domain-containing protein